MAKRKPTEIVQLKVRLREGLRAQLEAQAKKKSISLNAEIVFRLAESFEMEGINSIGDRLDALETQTAELRDSLVKELKILEPKK